MLVKRPLSSISQQLRGRVALSGSVTAMLRTELHSVLMPLACAHLREAEQAESRGESALGDVAAFVLLSHCALNSFLWSTWQDVGAARPTMIDTQIKEARQGRGHFPSFYEFVKAVGRGTDGKQCIGSSHLKKIKEYIKHRNELLQHSLQEFSDAGSMTTVREILTAAYAEEVWKCLCEAIRAISGKYGRNVGWIDRC